MKEIKVILFVWFLSAMIVFFTGCTGGLAVQMVELSSNEQLLIRRQNIGAGMRELNSTGDDVYKGRMAAANEAASGS